MRISTNLIYQQGVSSMQRQQAELAKTQQQMSLGTRMLSPSDDPVGAARLVLVDQASATNAQYKANRDAARSALGLEETALASLGGVIQDIRTTAVYAGNPTLTNADRAALVAELSSRFQQLMGLANTTDGTGQYLFSGYQGAEQPFAGGVGNVVYSGDQGRRLVQVSATRQLAVSDSGSDIFLSVGKENAAVLEAASAANTGTGAIGQGAVTSAAQVTGHNYAIRFTVAGGAATFDVVDTITGAPVGAPLASSNAYTPGAAISFAGMQVTITGAPANGDEFSVSASRPLFSAVSDLIAAIGMPVTDAAGNVRISNAVSAALGNLDQALERVLTVRADVGARMQELDSLDDMGEGMALQYEKTASGLRDLDYAAAVSDLTRQQMMLEAAQRSFTRIAGMSLFDFI